MSLDKTQILDAARAAFARHGFRKTSLGDIAQPLGVAKTALYHHFPGGKEDIFHAVINREEETVLANMEEAVALEDNPSRRLRALVLAKLIHLRHLRDLLMVPRDVGEEVSLLYEAHETAFRTAERALIARILATGQEVGLFRRIDLEALAIRVQFVLNRMELPLLFEESPEEMTRELDGLLDLLLHGILKQEAGQDG